MNDKTALKVLRKLVLLAEKANKGQTAMSMDEVFDDDNDIKEWLEAWAAAKAVLANVAAKPN